MKLTSLAAAFAVSFALPAIAAEGITIVDPYARVSTAMSQSGAAFMLIENHGQSDHRLIGAQSDVAERVELHTHREDVDGVMRMVQLDEGILIPGGGTHAMDRGGDHIMFLGLTRAVAHGDEITLTLQFENADPMEITVPVDLERMPEPRHGQAHSHGHGHGHSHGHDDSRSHD